MRAEFGPCTILSGFRTEERNRLVGGAPSSYHRWRANSLTPIAVDVTFPRGFPHEWAKFAERLLQRHNGGTGGTGVYASARFLHLDNRGSVRARW